MTKMNQALQQNRPAQPSKLEAHRFAGRQLQALRLTMGISRAVLGRELGISGQQVHKYENGINRLTVDKVCAMAALFEVPVTVFFSSDAVDLPVTHLPQGSTRLVKLINKISDEHHESLYMIIRALLCIIYKENEQDDEPFLQIKAP